MSQLHFKRCCCLKYSLVSVFLCAVDMQPCPVDMDRIALCPGGKKRVSYSFRPYTALHLAIAVGVQDECASRAQVWAWGSTPECPSINMSIQSLLFLRSDGDPVLVQRRMGSSKSRLDMYACAHA